METIGQQLRKASMYGTSKLRFEQHQLPQGLDIIAPLSGNVLPLEEAHGALARRRILGDGIVLEPTGEQLLAPFDGTLMRRSSCGKHWLLRASSGLLLALLFHHPFSSLLGTVIRPRCHTGQGFSRGQPLAVLDLPRFRQQHQPQICILLPNSDKLGQILCRPQAHLAGQDSLFVITRD